MSIRSGRKRLLSGSSLALLSACGTVLGALAALIVALFGDGVFTKGDSASAAVGASVDELARATVQIRAVDERGDLVWWGSGSVITSDGLILTAGHLVDDRLGEYEHLEVGVTDDLNSPPAAKYRAEIQSADYALDLAVIRIDSDLNGNKVALDRPYISIGDSNKTQLLSRLRILGFPATGGTGLTGTVGTVSGFEFSDNIDGRAFIKTDAATSQGSSGGMVANDDGELIGVVVQFGSGDQESPIVDCLPDIQDTNGDGLVDEADSCVPIGGVNALRPINLAHQLIDAARQQRPYKPQLPQPDPLPSSEHDLSGIVFDNLAFSVDRQEAEGRAVLVAFPSGTHQICGSWAYSGMAEGMRWDAVWYINGFRLDEQSQARQRWGLGAQGAAAPVCLQDPDGLPNGFYELKLSVEGALQTVGNVYVGPTVEFTVTNSTELQICYLDLSPVDMSEWGPSDLPPDVVIEPGQSSRLQVPSGRYDFRATDCADTEVQVGYRIEVEEGGSLLIEREN